MMDLGQTLKNARERKGYSLREVEGKLNEKGISYAHTNIKRIEDGENNKTSIKVLAGLCEVYSLDKINIMNLAGANIEEFVELNDIVKKATLFFNDKNVDEDDKKKLLEVMNEMFYKSKFDK
ncbi:helix-turn-helix domain-containing protein [Streptobacillus moniliformis]|nr:helix-turn-helix transcriptional regulator [Streptobacillus moniliformis]QXW65610.1 helix-turn-helix domain-containing protein [Streptobacillus moniliformis]SQA14002.1 Uncharacterised protein [Streptobacillus moniliformis]